MCSCSNFSRFISEKTHLTIQQNSFFSFLFLKRALSSHLSIDCQYSCCKKFCISGLLMLNADLYLAYYFFFSVVKLVNSVYTELYSSQQEVLTCIYSIFFKFPVLYGFKCYFGHQRLREKSVVFLQYDGAPILCDEISFLAAQGDRNQLCLTPEYHHDPYCQIFIEYKSYMTGDILKVWSHRGFYHELCQSVNGNASFRWGVDSHVCHIVNWWRKIRIFFIL